MFVTFLVLYSINTNIYHLPAIHVNTSRLTYTFTSVFKGQVHVFAGQVKIFKSLVQQDKCNIKYFCPLILILISDQSSNCFFNLIWICYADKNALNGPHHEKTCL